MEIRRWFFWVMLLVLLLLVASQEQQQQQQQQGIMAAGGRGRGNDEDEMKGRTCEAQSHGFKGICLSDHNCGLVCRNEGFSDGWCRGARKRCFCAKPC